MIPPELAEWIYPELADGTPDAAILQHDCGVDFQFRCDDFDGQQFVVSKSHLKKWRTNISRLAAIAGSNCFSYNELESISEGVYEHDDGNTLAILFSPATFLEHNHVDGSPLLLLVDAKTCILTGTNSDAGVSILKTRLSDAIASRIVTIDNKWENWISADID